MTHLALVASPPHARKWLDYREALAAGRCQKCAGQDVGARTIGIRRPDADFWTRLSLCAPCIDRVREQGYVVVA